MNPNSHQRTTPKPQAGWGRDGLAPPPRISLRPLFDSHRRSYSAERAPGTSDFPSVAVVLAARGGEPPIQYRAYTQVVPQSARDPQRPGGPRPALLPHQVPPQNLRRPQSNRP